MIDATIFDNFPEVRKEYENDPHNWYACFNKSDVLQTRMLIRGKNIYVTKIRPDIFKSLYAKLRLKQEITADKLNEFTLKHVDRDIPIEEVRSKSPNELANMILNILNNSDIKSNKKSKTVFEGPIYMKFKGTFLPVAVYTKKKNYFSLYSKTDPFLVYFEDESLKKYRGMEITLDNIAANEFRHTYS
jgi:hypothetical protein